VGRIRGGLFDINNGGDMIGMGYDHFREFVYADGEIVSLKEAAPLNTEAGWNYVLPPERMNDAGQILGNGIFRDGSCAYLSHSGACPCSFRAAAHRSVGAGQHPDRQSTGHPLAAAARPVPHHFLISSGKRDVILGLFAHELASLIQNPVARRELESAGLSVAHTALQELTPKATEEAAQGAEASEAA
jgi:hypothetical protein